MEKVIGKIRFASWTTILLCGTAAVYFAMAVPETELVRSSERDERIRKIEGTSDVRQLQNELKGLVMVGANTITTSKVLGCLSVFVFIVCIIGSSVTLRNARKLERDTK